MTTTTQQLVDTCKLLQDLRVVLAYEQERIKPIHATCSDEPMVSLYYENLRNLMRRTDTQIALLDQQIINS